MPLHTCHRLRIRIRHRESGLPDELYRRGHRAAESVDDRGAGTRDDWASAGSETQGRTQYPRERGSGREASGGESGSAEGDSAKNGEMLVPWRVAMW